MFPQRFFITGTDTGVGKTLVAAILMAGLAAEYWKPVQSGMKEGSDTEMVRRLTGLPAARFWPESYCLAEPLSPHAAAALAGVNIDLDRCRLPAAAGSRLLVEGAGGVMVPLNGEECMVDLMRRLALPILLVARSGLGTINHTLLSLAALRAAGLAVFGVVLNGPRNAGNRAAIVHFGRLPVVGELLPQGDLAGLEMGKIFRETFAPPWCGEEDE